METFRLLIKRNLSTSLVVVSFNNAFEVSNVKNLKQYIKHEEECFIVIFNTPRSELKNRGTAKFFSFSFSLYFFLKL